MQEDLARRSLRVLALVWRTVPGVLQPSRLEEDMVLAGLVGLEDPPRVEVPEAIRQCREAGIRAVMVTGDHPRTASQIAREIGPALDAPGIHFCAHRRRSEAADRRCAKAQGRGGVGHGRKRCPGTRGVRASELPWA